MRFIHIGVGGFGRRWTEVLKNNSDAEVVGMVDISEEALAAACEAGGYASDICYTSLEKALDTVPTDAVVISTPPALHTPQVLAALDRELHVITEKPMADTLENCKTLLKATHASGQTYVVSQNYRYSPATWTIGQQVRQGAIGDVGQVKIDFFKGVGFDGFRAEMDYPLIIDMSIHHFDLIRFITGLDPVSVRGESWNPPWSHYKGDASSCLVFTMSNGARILYNGSWCAQGSYSNWNGNWQIEGSKGALIYANEEIHLNAVGPKYKVEEQRLIEPQEPPRLAQDYVLDDFMKSIDTGQRPATDVYDNIRSVAMVFAAVQALETGQEVQVGDEEINAILDSL